MHIRRGGHCRSAIRPPSPTAPDDCQDGPLVPSASKLCIGMVRFREDRIARSDLHNAAEIHDRYSMRDVADNAQIMRNE